MGHPWLKYQAAPAISSQPWLKYAATEPQRSNEAGKSNRELSMGETAVDAAKSLGSGLVKGAAGLVGIPGDVSNLTIAALGKLNGQSPEEIARIQGTNMLPTSEDVTGFVEKNITGPLHEPQSTAGDFADTIGEFAPNAIGGGGGLIRKGAMVVLPAVASEAAGKLTNENPVARVVAGIAGGGLANIKGGTNAIKTLAKGAPTHEEVKATTDALYGQLRDAGIKYDSNAYHNMATELGAELKKDGFRAAQAPMSADALNAIVEKVGQPLDFNDFESLRKIASQITREQAASSTDKLVAGKIVDALDKFAGGAAYIHNGTAPNAPLLMKQAREMARRNIIGKQIEDMTAKAETYQSGFESGLKNQFSNYLRSNKGKSLTPAERLAFLQVAKGGFTRNALTTLGRFGFDFSKMGNIATLIPVGAAGAAYYSGDKEKAAALLALGTGAKFMSRNMVRNAAERAKSTVLAGRKAQNSAVMEALKNTTKSRVRTALNTEASLHQADKGKLAPLKLPNGTTLWNPTADDYQKYAAKP